MGPFDLTRRAIRRPIPEVPLRGFADPQREAGPWSITSSSTPPAAGGQAGLKAVPSGCERRCCPRDVDHVTQLKSAHADA